MRKLILALALTSSTAFAGSFIKTDLGSVSWSVKIKDKTGTMVLIRNSKTTNNRDLTIDEQLKISTGMLTFAGLGTIGVETAKFENSDERSKETVEALIEIKMAEELSRLSVNISSSEVRLKNLTCKEAGFFKKRLECSAQFESILDVEFK